MPNSHGEELLMDIETSPATNPENREEIREVDPFTRRLEVLCYMRDKLMDSVPGELAVDQEAIRDATVELSSKVKLDLGQPPERVVSFPEDLAKQVVEQERRERLRDYITLAYYAGVVGAVQVVVKEVVKNEDGSETVEDVVKDTTAYEEVILPLVERLIDPQDSAVIVSSHKDGDNARIKNTPREGIPNSLPVADWFDSKSHPFNPSERSY